MAVCYGKEAGSVDRGSKADPFLGNIGLNREIAYLGKTGLKRKRFCINYAEYKQRTLEEVAEQQSREAARTGDSISCHKGCYFCCGELVCCSLQESELIVYNLYQNQQKLESFLQLFPVWFEKVQRNKSLLDEIGELQIREIRERGITQEQSNRKRDLLISYWKQQNLCPLLVGGVCSIYEARPFACADLAVTTPSDWCDPKRNVGQVCILPSYRLATEPGFWDERFRGLRLGNTPLMVYNILTAGYSFLSQIPGLKTLGEEVAADPEIRAVLRRGYS